MKPEWISAIENLTANGYRRTKQGKFEAFCSDHGNYIYLGTYDTVAEAEEATFNYRLDRFDSRIREYELNPDDGVVFMGDYVAFCNGMIFNLNGERIVGSINRDGYRQGIFHGQNIQFHRIIASIFCERELGRDCVNHIDGNKTNNSADNLEWVTKSENTRHSYRNGLQKTVNGSPIYTDNEKNYIREHCFDDYRTVSQHLNRNSETVRKYMQKYRKEIKNVKD